MAQGVKGGTLGARAFPSIAKESLDRRRPVSLPRVFVGPVRLQPPTHPLGGAADAIFQPD